MTAVLLTPLTGQLFDNNGDPLNGGLVYSYVAGTAFGTPLATYTSATGLTPAANPVVLNSAGRADIWGSGTYDFKITDSAGNIIDTVMSVTAIFGSGDMTKAVYDPANISQQLVGTTASQTLTNKIVNGVTLTAAGSATTVLNGAGNYIAISGGTSQVTGSNPTGSADATGKMMGLAGAITPTKSGKIGFLITGDISFNNDGSTGAVTAYYGTSTAPTNGASITGTAVGSQKRFNVNGLTSPNGIVPFACGGIVTGLTLNTAYWLDTAVKNASGSSITTIANVDIMAWEI